MMLFMVLGGLLSLVLIGVVIYLVARKLRQDDALMVLRPKVRSQKRNTASGSLYCDSNSLRHRG